VILIAYQVQVTDISAGLTVRNKFRCLDGQACAVGKFQGQACVNVAHVSKVKAEGVEVAVGWLIKIPSDTSSVIAIKPHVAGAIFFTTEFTGVVTLNH